MHIDGGELDFNNTDINDKAHAAKNVAGKILRAQLETVVEIFSIAAESQGYDDIFCFMENCGQTEDIVHEVLANLNMSLTRDVVTVDDISTGDFIRFTPIAVSEDSFGGKVEVSDGTMTLSYINSEGFPKERKIDKARLVGRDRAYNVELYDEEDAMWYCIEQ